MIANTTGRCHGFTRHRHRRDIGQSRVRDGDGRLLWTGKSQAFARPDTAQIVAAIRQATEGYEFAAEAVGLCCPGLLDRARRVITLSVNVPGLVDVPLDELVAKALGTSAPGVAILSDAGAVAYDIYVERRLSGRLLCLALGTGVGHRWSMGGGTSCTSAANRRGILDSWMSRWMIRRRSDRMAARDRWRRISARRRWRRGMATRRGWSG